jgi:hypothetical protein
VLPRFLCSKDIHMVRILMLAVPTVFAMYIPTCVPRAVLPSVPPGEARISELWRQPEDLATRDLFYGPWGPERAPDPEATYTFIELKQGGVNPGMTVRDPGGREWKVKQPPTDGRGAEGPVEVVLSRVLSAVGYHQPPVYYLPSFVVTDPSGSRRVPGGRFRVKDRALKDVGEWSWQQNPFVGTRPYQGLLVILLMFNSSDLKNSNNTLYEFRGSPGGVERWYVVRDLGTALGSTGRIAPIRGNADVFDRHGFIEGVEDGFVRFAYHGWHQELVDARITPADVGWACDLLDGLTDVQWQEAFRAGGYGAADAGRFIQRLDAKIREGRNLNRVAGGPAQ